MRDLKIKKVLNGFRVKIGCQEVVFTSKKKLMKELSRYIDNPSGVTKEYLEKYSQKSSNPKPESVVVEMTNGPTFGNIGIVYGDMHIDEDKAVTVTE